MTSVLVYFVFPKVYLYLFESQSEKERDWGTGKDVPPSGALWKRPQWSGSRAYSRSPMCVQGPKHSGHPPLHLFMNVNNSSSFSTSSSTFVFHVLFSTWSFCWVWGIMSWLWFIFSYWLTVLNICSCTYWLLIYIFLSKILVAYYLFIWNTKRPFKSSKLFWIFK